MSDEEFSAFLGGCREELEVLQPQFQQRIGEDRPWFYDLSVGTLKIGEEIYPMVPIGTYSDEYQSWLWAWANDEFPTLARDAARRLQSLHAVTGFQVFKDPGVGASSNDAQDFVALAVHCLGAIGFFRVPGNPTLYLAVQEPFSDERNASLGSGR